MTNDTPTLPRFLTLGGAIVQLVRHPRPVPIDTGDVMWRCEGCGQRGSDAPWSAGTAESYPVSLDDARQAANEHAGQCRSTPADRDPVFVAAAMAVLASLAGKDFSL
ncbi:hypothetical protein [Actinomadura rudentiformis]|uniref:Uncharacterized protein n=1 Tax=Actinomadura rudentiformis TaxID=359158 RepID=A0A6H9YK38_9ACTN|nr:hypothetical protein [Actinomadura rudentiformis]KAB2347375.1 hypothetical protein F8566_20395 [Actinomadura rudentiformis]